MKSYFKIKYLKFLIICINLFFSSLSSYSQNYYKGTIDTVVSLIPGTLQSNGQSSEYFPANIFGLPSKQASKNVPEVGEDEICSIGLNGEIIVGFKDSYLYDGEGDDFIVFENAFINPINKKIFAEPGIISVSEDGVNFIQFPFDSVTLEGCAGITPTNGSEDIFDPSSSGGNSFDLFSVGLSKIKYIKINDYCGEILKNSNHIYYDPIISGFDLDAITARYLVKDETSIEDKYKIYNYFENNKYIINKKQIIEIFHNSFVKYVSNLNIMIYDYIGNEQMNIPNVEQIEKINTLKDGTYLLKFETSSQIFCEIIYLNN
jgi:hypothetical protein